MTMEADLSNEQVDAVIAALDSLCQKEYRLSLDEVRRDDDRQVAALRLERLTGILLKRHFARAKKRTAKHPSSQTDARRIWEWDLKKLDTGVRGAEAELALLNWLRGPGPWNEPWDWAEKEADGSALTWEAFTDDVDSERGLFKVTALYLKDVLGRRERQSIAEYYRAEESEALKRGLDLSMVFAGAALGPIYAAVGVPSVAVGLVLFLADVGAARLFSEDRQPDDWA
ncbi:MAG: hypothetical protein ACE5HV_15805 [Acidobacteriota bacterium]